MTTQPKPFPISWDEFHRHSRALAWRLVDKGPWQGIIAVTRGGLIPAGIIARELEVRVIETVCVSSYDHMAQREARILKDVGENVLATGGKGWLIVDDLVDSGKTFEILRKNLPNAHYAAVYAKPTGRPQVDTFVSEFSQDTWLDFPWDIAPQYSQPIAELHKAGPR